MLGWPQARTHTATGSEAREAGEGAWVGGQQWEPQGTQSLELICKEAGLEDKPSVVPRDPNPQAKLWGQRKVGGGPRPLTRAPRRTQLRGRANCPAPARITAALPMGIVASEVSGTAAHDQRREAGASTVVCKGVGGREDPLQTSNPSSTSTIRRTDLLASLCLSFSIHG